MEKFRIVGLTVVFLLICAGVAFANDTCKSCHDGQEDRFVKNTHARLETSCVSCHGEAVKHQQDPSELDMLDMKDPKSAEAVNAACMSCHANNQRMMFWDGSEHDRADVSCTSCHSIHTVGTEKVSMDKCLSCHKDVRRDVNKFSHHPLAEGKMECASCHEVHGTLAPALITADTNNELCYNCHTEKRGPFRFAHPPVEENCLNCHSPHGTNAARLMTQNVRNTCGNCHQYAHKATLDTQVGGGGATAFVKRGSCLSCHGAIHGSNTDWHFR